MSFLCTAYSTATDNYSILRSHARRFEETSAPSLETYQYPAIVFCTCLFTAKVLYEIYTKFIDLKSLPDQNARVQATFNRLLNEKGADIYWLPQPFFVEQDPPERFPIERFHAIDTPPPFDYRLFDPQKLDKYPFSLVNNLMIRWQQAKIEKRIERVYGQYQQDPTIGSNAFLKWLNGDAELFHKEDFLKSDGPYFMSCVDFFYLTLYLADLISKEQIVFLYKKHISNRMSVANSNDFYGVDGLC